MKIVEEHNEEETTKKEEKQKAVLSIDDVLKCEVELDMFYQELTYAINTPGRRTINVGFSKAMIMKDVIMLVFRFVERKNETLYYELIEVLKDNGEKGKENQSDI